MLQTLFTHTAPASGARRRVFIAFQGLNAQKELAFEKNDCTGGAIYMSNRIGTA